MQVGGLNWRSAAIPGSSGDTIGGASACVSEHRGKLSGDHGLSSSAHVLVWFSKGVPILMQQHARQQVIRFGLDRALALLALWSASLLMLSTRSQAGPGLHATCGLAASSADSRVEGEAAGFGETDEVAVEAKVSQPSSVKEPLRLERGENRQSILVPRDEELVYDVHVGWGIIGAALGTVTMSSGVERYRPNLLLPQPGDKEAGERYTCWMKAHAYGKHLLYTMDATLESRIQPQEWPRVVYRSTQSGSENRRRELLVGKKKDGIWASYRKDTSRGAPSGTRIWREPVEKEVPEDAVDMISAVYLARTAIADGLSEVRFPLIDKLDLWNMTIKRGEASIQETPLGKFRVVQVLIDPKPFVGEDVDEERVERFEGLFGLQGQVGIWMHEGTGVPVRIQGILPVGVLELEVDITLTKYKGTPEAFVPESESGSDG